MALIKYCTWILLALVSFNSFYLSWLFYSSVDGKLRISLIWFFALLGMLSLNLLVREVVFVNDMLHIGLCLLFAISLSFLLVVALEVRKGRLEDVLTIVDPDQEE